MGNAIYWHALSPCCSIATTCTESNSIVAAPPLMASLMEPQAISFPNRFSNRNQQLLFKWEEVRFKSLVWQRNGGNYVRRNPFLLLFLLDHQQQQQQQMLLGISLSRATAYAAAAGKAQTEQSTDHHHYYYTTHPCRIQQHSDYRRRLLRTSPSHSTSLYYTVVPSSEACCQQLLHDWEEDAFLKRPDASSRTEHSTV